MVEQKFAVFRSTVNGTIVGTGVYEFSTESGKTNGSSETLWGLADLLKREFHKHVRVVIDFHPSHGIELIPGEVPKLCTPLERYDQERLFEFLAS